MLTRPFINFSDEVRGTIYDCEFPVWGIVVVAFYPVVPVYCNNEPVVTAVGVEIEVVDGKLASGR